MDETDDMFARMRAELADHMGDLAIFGARASYCYRADACMMDGGCPFIDDCKGAVAED
jgi:hypothetical protein